MFAKALAFLLGTADQFISKPLQAGVALGVDLFVLRNQQFNFLLGLNDRPVCFCLDLFSRFRKRRSRAVATELLEAKSVPVQVRLTGQVIKPFRKSICIRSNRSLSLYAKLGFDMREFMSVMQGPPINKTQRRLSCATSNVL
jgi:hypothetical protein